MSYFVCRRFKYLINGIYIQNVYNRCVHFIISAYSLQNVSFNIINHK